MPLSSTGSGFEPAYLKLYRTGELQRRAAAAVASLSHCTGCPRRCGTDRQAGRTGTCRIGRYARVASYFPHFGEEDCLRGWAGSGTIFFSGCNLRCVFCQNHDISQAAVGEETPPAQLAGMMLELQAAGCHNLNLVTPEHVVPQVLEALVLAADAGLRLPLVYNTSAYDALESLGWLEGVVDIYMPDFKLWTPALAQQYLLARDYPAAARRALQEMHRQVGPLQLDGHGLARQGVLVRHLVMPGLLGETRAILRFLSHELSADTYLNLMDQYRPAYRVRTGGFEAIHRHLEPMEYAQAVALAHACGLTRLERRAAA